MNEAVFLSLLFLGCIGFCWLLYRAIQFWAWLSVAAGVITLLVEGLIVVGLWVVVLLGSVLLNRLFSDGSLPVLLVMSLVALVMLIPWVGVVRIEMWLRAQRRKAREPDGSRGY